MIPLSFAQRRLWFLGQLEGPSSAYNLSTSLRLSGSLNLAALHAALRDVLDRHEVLRTLYRVTDGEPHQHILGLDELAWEPPAVEPVDGDALAEAVTRVESHAFDLSTEISVRTRLFAL